MKCASVSLQFGFKMTSKDNIMGHGSPYDQELREYDEEPVSIRSGSVARDNPVEERKGDMVRVVCEGLFFMVI